MPKPIGSQDFYFFVRVTSYSYSSHTPRVLFAPTIS